MWWEWMRECKSDFKEWSGVEETIQDFLQQFLRSFTRFCVIFWPLEFELRH